MKQIISIAFFIILLASCSNDLFNVLDKNNILPQVSKPVVMSFKVEKQIIINWTADPGADSYYLYRYLDFDRPLGEKIFEVNALSFIDTQTDDGTIYYYKLSKKKGLKEFDKSDCAMGVGSNTARDSYEDNDTKEQAKEFVDTVDANIFYYKDLAGNTLEDTDWYWTTVPARQRMTISITFVGNNLANNDITFGLEGANPIDITSGATYEISNTSNNARKVPFVIAIDRDNYLSNSGGVGGKLGFYKIKYEQTN